ncbi:MAG: hypothetical protein O3A36_00705 [bacterium]|nr:hypothetical protein [bacterium]
MMPRRKEYISKDLNAWPAKDMPRIFGMATDITTEEFSLHTSTRELIFALVTKKR